MVFSKASCGRLPLSMLPLMKNPGVPVSPALSPSCRSCSICALYLPLDRQESNCFSSSFRRRACSTRPSRFSLLGFSKRSEEHTSELQSPCNLVCRLLLEKKKNLYYEHMKADGNRCAVRSSSAAFGILVYAPTNCD